MLRLTFDEVYDLKLQTQELGYCNLTTEKVFSLLYDKEYDTYNDFPILDDYDDAIEDILLRKGEVVVDAIKEDILTNGVSFITIANSSGEDKTFWHTFVLVLTDNGEVIRLESYGSDNLLQTCHTSLYTTRIVEWNTYEQDILKLFSFKPGVERIAYYNGLFSANETEDTSFDLDVTIYIEE